MLCNNSLVFDNACDISDTSTEAQRTPNLKNLWLSDKLLNHADKWCKRNASPFTECSFP